VSSDRPVHKPRIALFSGDPAGIGPELVQKLLDEPSRYQQVHLHLIGQQAALRVPAGLTLHAWDGSLTPSFAPGLANADNGRYMLEGLRQGLALAQQAKVDAFCFAPLNKSALRAAGMQQEDELRWFADYLRFEGDCGELNVLENLWTARVTSHVALREVSRLLSAQKVAAAIALIHQSLTRAGLKQPRIAVCGLNPHNGDHGNYGDEEATIITPGIALAKMKGYEAEGPFPADTTFVRAVRKPGGYDGVVTMYHDQGQIAMKLLGFDRGVTVHGGLPYPITTPAHGTAYDIAGQGIANPQAFFNAFDLACLMALGDRTI
jgi:4-hydroxythreonine-4-phosphate dehydrogenase